MYKLAFLYICQIISDAILGSNCHPNATEAEIEKECSMWMRTCVCKRLSDSIGPIHACTVKGYRYNIVPISHCFLELG